MNAPNKGHVYYTQLFPLVQRIVDIARANGIAMFASFALPTPEAPDMMCTTLLPDGNDVEFPPFRECVNAVGAPR